MRRPLLLVGVFSVLSTFGAIENETTVILENGRAQLEVQLAGGAISSFTHASSAINPFSWKSKWRPGCQGLFLCFDRIGKSSAEDQKKGIPLHGEAHSLLWNLVERSSHPNIRLVIECELPITRLKVIREITLFSDSTACRIRDRFINLTGDEKPFNMLHHPSMGPPFLSDQLIIDTNADQGFVNVKQGEDLNGHIVNWPSFNHQSTHIDLRRMEYSENIVVNFRTVAGTKVGWGSVANPEKQLMVGYCWDIKEMPWIRIWREWQNHTPTAFGMEIGTSPFGMPFDEIQKIGPVLKQPTLSVLPPHGEVEKTLYVFITDIPPDYRGTHSISSGPESIQLNGYSKSGASSFTFNIIE